MVGGPGGYLMVGEDGGIFSFGRCRSSGRWGRTRRRSPIVAVAVTGRPVAVPLAPATTDHHGAHGRPTTTTAPPSSTAGATTSTHLKIKPSTTTTRGDGVWYANCQEAGAAGRPEHPQG